MFTFISHSNCRLSTLLCLLRSWSSSQGRLNFTHFNCAIQLNNSHIIIIQTSPDLSIHYCQFQGDFVRQEYEALYEKSCSKKGAVQKTSRCATFINFRTKNHIYCIKKVESDKNTVWTPFAACSEFPSSNVSYITAACVDHTLFFMDWFYYNLIILIK